MTSVLSESLKHVLSLRETSRTCPPDFAKACANLALFTESASSGVRFTGLSTSARPSSSSEDGFEHVQNRKGRGYGGNSSRNGYGGGGASSYSGGASSYGSGNASGYGGGNTSNHGEGGDHGYGRNNRHGERDRGGFNRVSQNSQNSQSNYSNTGVKRSFGSSAPSTTESVVVKPLVSSSAVSSSVVSSSSAVSESVGPTSVVIESKETEAPVIAFSSAAVRTGVSSRDRVLQRIKGKLNRMGFNTYDKTKDSMREMLDGDEIEYLDEILAYIFQKAATESMYCALFAKLLHELSGEFPHFRTAMRKLFQDYTGIFTEGVETAEHDSEEYKHWLDIQERKKFRRGYSQFVSELVKLGEADTEAFEKLLQESVRVLEASCTNPEKVHLSEEYSDCLQTMCVSASALLSTASWAADLVSRIDALSVYELTAKPPGFSTRGLVILKNLTDYAKRGWKPLSL